MPLAFFWIPRLPLSPSPPIRDGQRQFAVILLLGSLLCPLPLIAQSPATTANPSWLSSTFDSPSSAPLVAVVATICTAVFGYLGAWAQLRFGERADLRSALEAKDAKLDAKLDAHTKTLTEELKDERARNEEQGRALLEALREKNEEAAFRKLCEIELSRTKSGRDFLARVRGAQEAASLTRRLVEKEKQGDSPGAISPSPLGSTTQPAGV